MFPNPGRGFSSARLSISKERDSVRAVEKSNLLCFSLQKQRVQVAHLATTFVLLLQLGDRCWEPALPLNASQGGRDSCGGLLVLVSKMPGGR
jgi:hypothetical protein